MCTGAIFTTRAGSIAPVMLGLRRAADPKRQVSENPTIAGHGKGL
jgi:hypothetical protein